MSVSSEVIRAISESGSLVCRVCLNSAVPVRPLFVPETDPEPSPAHMLAVVASVRLSYGDGLPENVCQECAEQITSFFDFKQLAEKSDSILQFCVDKGYVHALNLEPSLPATFQNDETYEKLMKAENITENVAIETYPDDYEESPSPNINVQLDTLNCKNDQDLFQKNLICDSIQSDVSDSKNSIFMNLKENDTRKRKSKSKAAKSASIDNNDFQSDSEILSDKHLKEFSDSPELKTDECTLKKGSDRKKSNVDNLICGWCGKQFPNQHRLTRHERIHQKEKLYNCSTCKKGFNEFRDYHRHILRHKKLEKDEEINLDALNYPCPQCHMKFTSETDLDIHSSVHLETGDKRVCQHCKKEFKTTLQLKRHVRTHLIDKPHKCSVCHKGFPEMGSLTRHFRRHTGEIRERKHVCNICKKAYYDRHALSVHERSHTGEKPWECSECGKRFVDSRLLNSHRKTHSDLKPHACNICDKSFRHESTLTTHKRTHTGEKPYICSVCGNAFVQSSNLSLHMRTHTRERPYSCEFCSKKFSSSSALTTHVRTHTGEKPYVCTICLKRFARYDMRTHMRTHTGEKPFVCTVCNRRFITPGQLQQHLRIHTGERPFTCTICGKGCTTSCYLKRHMAKTHNMMTVTPNISTIIDSKIDSIDNPDDCILTAKSKTESSDVVISRQVLNIAPSLTLSANNLNVMTVDGSNAELNDLGISTCITTDDHDMVSTEVNVDTIVTNTLISDDKLYQIDPGLIRIHHVSTANLIHSGQITLSSLTNTTH